MLEHTAGKIRLYKTPNSSLKGQMKYLVTNDNDENKCHSELVEETTASRALLKSNDTSVESSERSSSRALINNAEALTLINPVAGSGHILGEGFELLYKCM